MKAVLVLWVLAVFETTTRAERDRRPPQPPVEWQGYSIAFHFLLPLAGLLLLWGKPDLFNRLLSHVDRSCLSVFCPSFSKRQNLLKWAMENLPNTWSSSSKTLSGGIPDLWKDGSLLCTLINMAVPGACSNPPKHWKKSPTHAQALAYKYLGVIPVFQESDFKEPLSPNQERKFLLYLQDLQQAIRSRGSRDTCTKFSDSYVAKGMGLQNGVQYKKTTFYVYSNTNNPNCNNVLVYIRGPYDTQGTATIPAFYNLNPSPILTSLHRQYRPTDKIIFKKEARKSFLKSIALDLSSLVNFDKRSTSNDISIHVEMETDRAKVSYIPLNFGIYEINLITDGEILANSPFTVSVSEDNSGTRDSFDTTEKILEQLPKLKKRKIVARFIDCINEKILLDYDANETLSTSRESRHELPSTFFTNDLEDNFKEEDKSLETDEKFIKFSEDNLPPILTVTEHEEFESTFLLNDDQIGSLSELKSPKIVRIVQADTETPIDSLEIYEELEEPKSDSPLSIEETFEIVTSDCPTSGSTQNLSHFEKTALEVTKVSEGSKTEDLVQKRPTSIVSPFLITPKYDEKSNDVSQEPATIEEEEEEETLEALNNKNTDLNHNSEKTPEISYTPRKLILMRNSIKNSYVERLKAILVNKLTESENSKTIKNIVNTSSKLSRMKETQQDENNNSFENSFLRVTSPICPNHIVPEVEEESPFIPVSERRKLFARQTHLSLPSSNNSSFSEKENEDVANELSDNCSLRLLSVIDTIRKSTNLSLNRTISNSTPNISTSKSFSSMGSNSEGSKDSRSSFIETRKYWLSLSTENCSNIPSKFLKHDKLEPRTLLNASKVFSEKYRSAEDVTAISRMSFNRKLKKYSSLNQKDFEAIEFMSLEERKKILLQDKYEEEKKATRFVKRNVIVNKNTEITNDDKTKSAQEMPAQVERNATMSNNYPEKKKTEEIKPPTQFKKAITFFKNLENSNHQKRKLPLRPKPEIKRRFSSDFIEKKKKDKSIIGGSLRLPKTSEKFSVARIYFDIMENKRGSFRGTPNREALSESLASLTSRTEEILDKSDGPIELSMFKNKVKPRKRKSLKSIFNIHY
ncbi:uncharacterized protein LOC123684632 isoform X2 [Harmonia axyridis]|uniref:uncharacterized protein LOC123684632 isoform X2 n=1 Tax=Harmonia axyridis TaxID=115357 RepID=UPI001E27809A|nr:uncharacterized protein LOC123684632 isoform X2 [Harmonia axyridis]